MFAIWTALLACTPEPPPVVLLVTLDTTRADAIGAYGADPSPTPHLDALAVRGRRFEDVWSPVPLTLPAHTSMFTGLSADRHGVRTNDGYAVPGDLSLLAERFARGGYTTAAFVSSWVLDEQTGISRGFRHYEDLTPRGPCAGAPLRRTGAETVALALRFAAEHREEPLFLWVHLFDAHRPWAPSPGSSRRFPSDPYRASVADADGALGSLLAGLADRPLTALVTADHGEGLGDHGEQGHGWLLHGATLRVPLVLAGPGVEPGLDADPRGLIDVGPTLAAIAGFTPISGAEGADLREPAPPGRVLFSETRSPAEAFGFQALSGAKQGDAWLVRGARSQRFNLASDPGEEHPLLAPEDPLNTAFLARGPDRLSPGSGLGDALVALGYAESEPGRVAAEGAPDPRDHPGFSEEVEREITAAWRGDAVALAALSARYAAHPEAPALRFALARLHAAAGDHAAAAALLAEGGGESSLDREVWRAEELVRARDPRGEAALTALLARAPHDPTIRALQAESARLAGECALVAELAAVRPEEERLRLIAGACALADGRLAEARGAAESVLGRCPTDPDALRLRGLTAFEGGDHRVAADDLLAIGAALSSEERLNLGISLVALEDPRAAAVLEGLADPVAQRLRAESLLRAGADPLVVLAALSALGPAIEADPVALRLRAQAKLRAGDAGGALLDVEQAGRITGEGP